MHGMIKCPVTNAVRNAFKKDFKLLSLPPECSSGYIYLRGSNPIGVAMTRSYNGDATRWICRPEISDMAISTHNLSKNDVLQKMLSDSCYGSECNGTAIKLTGDADELYKPMCEVSDFKFESTPGGGLIGKHCKRSEEGDITEAVVSEDCLNSINGMWSLDVIDPNPIRGIIGYVESKVCNERDNIMRIYAYAESTGKFTNVPVWHQMTSIINAYEEYFNDLTQFIKTKLDTPDCDKNDCAASSVKALDIDDKFVEELFGKKYSPGPASYPTVVVEILDSFITLSNFLYSINDSFIEIGGLCNDHLSSPSILALINVYGYSTTRFLRRYIQELFGHQYPMILAIANGTYASKDEPGKSNEFILV
mgnify:CR=1 FL=1